MKALNLNNRSQGWLLAALLLVLSLVFMEQTLIPENGQVLVGHDTHGLFYPWMTLAQEAIRAGRLPLWDATQASGYPFLHNPQVGFFYPPTWLAIILPVRVGLSLYTAFHIWVAALGMLLLVRFLNRPHQSWLGPLLAAFLFGFNGFVVARVTAGHLGLLATHAWLPWLLLATAWSVERGTLPAAFAPGAVFALAALAGHIPSLTYVGLVWFVFSIYLAITTRRWLLVIRQVLIAGLLGLAISAVQLVPTAQLILRSKRGSGLIGAVGDWSLPPDHLLTLLIPNFYGDVQLGAMSGRAFDEFTYYTGILPLIGLALAFRRPSRRTWMYVALAIFGVLVALGKYGFLYQLMYDLVPPFRLVRVPARALFLYVFAMSALLGDVIVTWEQAREEGQSAPAGVLIRWIMTIAAVLGVSGIAAAGALVAVREGGPVKQFPLEHYIGAWLALTALILTGGALLWRYLAAPAGNTRLRRGLAAALALFVLVDLWGFGFRMLITWPSEAGELWQDALPMIEDRSGRITPYNIWPWWIKNDPTLLGLLSTGGDVPLELAAYDEFVNFSDDLSSHAYDVLGSRYVVSWIELGPPHTSGEDALELVGHTDSAWVYRRPHPLPIVRLVYQAEIIPNSSDANGRLHEVSFDPAEAVILDQAPPCEVGSEAQAAGDVSVVAQWPGYWLIATTSEEPALLVLSETAYPGWRVTVDGQPAEPLTAYTTLKAVCVPAGAHQIEWRFAPRIFLAGAAITLPTLLLMAGVSIFAAARRRKAAPASSGNQPPQGGASHHAG
jgi:hypothetical protein